MDATEHTGRLFVISGPSGAGKGTICAGLREQTAVEISVSMTTRQPRKGEVDGQSYYFVTKEEFQTTIEKGGLLEYAEVYGNYYGTPKAMVFDKLAQGTDVILEIDIQGALKVKESYPDGVFIFILPPSLAELRQRIIGRGTETEASIDLRLSKTAEEISCIDKYDYFVINREVDEAVQRVKAIMTAEHSRVKGNIHSIIGKYKEEN